jgi:hypothetical protein
MSEPLVVESPHVGVLMDIGQKRIKIEKDAMAETGHGLSGYHDFINGMEDVTESDWRQMADQTIALDPQAWASVARASLMMTQASGDPQVLKDRLTHLGAIVVAWLEDVQNRAVA